MAPVEEVSSPALTQTRAIALLTELEQAFSRKTFQKKLEKLASKHDGSNEKAIRHLDGRRELAFKVQREVLGRYGFSVDESGVLAMKEALRGFLSDPEIAAKSRAVRLQLRLPLMQPGAISHAKAEDVQPVQFEPASPPAPTLLTSTRKSEQKMRDMSIKVTNPMDQQNMMITVSMGKQFPTVQEVKAAIVAQLGDGGSVDPASFRIVMGNGMGGYANRFDNERVKVNCVLAVGIKMSEAEA